jgi:hypothetical protein
MSSSPLSVTITIPHEYEACVQLLQQLAAEIESLPDARALEQTVHERLTELDQLTMQAGFRHKARHAVEKDIRHVRCAHCEDWASLLDAAAPRFAITVRGRVDFARPVFRCEDTDCHHERCVFDEELGLEPKEHYTPMAQNKIAYAGVSETSFGRARAELKHQLGWDISESDAYRITSKAAERARAAQDKEVERMGRPASADRPLPVQEQPETLVLEMDGTCVMGRDGVGHDVKCATVFGLDARARTGGDPGRPVLLRRCYTGTSKGIKPFGALVWAMLVAWGIRRAQRVVVVGDGAEWIWKYAADRLVFTLGNGQQTGPIEILDFYHASERLTQTRDSIFKNPEGEDAKEWLDHWVTLMREGHIEKVIEELRLRQKTVRGPARRAELEGQANYFENQKGRMNYPVYEAMGLPIGSGAIEGTYKNLVKGRMNCVGQRWDVEEGVENMVALRVRLFNNRFDELWQMPEMQQAA